MTPRRLALSVAAVIVELTKWWAVTSLEDGPVVLIEGFLQLRLVRNPGGAFGSLPGAGPIIALAALAAVVVIALIVHRLKGRWESVAMGLVLGGALGNLLDRVFRGPGLLDGKVVDFVDFDFFPTFNVADSAITIGAILAVLVALRAERT
jgi:signal peptidase II